jgi:hypothetical protein
MTNAHASRRRVAGALAALAALAIAAPAHADTVRDWNAHAVEALANAPKASVPGAGQTPPVSELHLAMVQGAVYDAVNAIDRGHRPYIAGLPRAARSASKGAAAATAAHHVLVGLEPALPAAVRDRLDALYASSLTSVPAGPGRDAGIRAGEAAARAMLAKRSTDRRFPSTPFSFTLGTKPGQWRPTPTTFANDPFAWVAKVQPFLLRNAAQVRTRGPKPLKSKAYAREFNEVKALGAETSATRTPRQTRLALFYTEHPVVLWNRTFRDVAQARGLNQADEARLFAMLNLAGADGLIGCWDDKAHYSFWRPITAIRLADSDGNPRTTADANWNSLIAAPPYPEHPSGYNCISASILRTANRFFGTDKLRFSVHSNASDADRSYKRISDAIGEVVDARVFEGIHFRTADEQAAQIGAKVARWLDGHFFQEVGRRGQRSHGAGRLTGR